MRVKTLLCFVYALTSVMSAPFKQERRLYLPPCKSDTWYVSLYNPIVLVTETLVYMQQGTCVPSFIISTVFLNILPRRLEQVCSNLRSILTLGCLLVATFIEL